MLSAVITTLNEQHNIAECIESLKQVADDIVVVDSYSSDNTVEIAESLGARVIMQKYLGDGIQKDLAVQHAHNDWVLSLDADERLTPEAVEAINKFDFAELSNASFSLRRRNYIGSRWIKHCGWYPDRCIRLFNKNKAGWKKVKQHAAVESSDNQALDVDFIHYSFDHVGQLFGKPGRDYGIRAAKIMYQQGKTVSSFSPFTHGLSAFVRAYLIKKGFLGGVDGLTVSFGVAFQSYIKYARLLELQRDPKVRENTNFDNVW